MKNWTHKNFTIHEFIELESTNSHAFELANSREISDREIILANSQNQGRGRGNRSWSSPQGNLYFSIVLKPKTTAQKIPQISFLGILALHEAIKKISNNSLKVKWPNDLLIDEKKVAGLLLESKISGTNCELVILGIGVNLISNPDNTIFPASNLKNFKVEIEPQDLLKKFLDEFEKIYQSWLDFGFENIRKLWLKNAYRLNEEISVKLGDERIAGVFEDVDLDGNMLLKSDGKILKISAADVL